MSIPFRSTPFKTSVGTHARSLDAWFGDILNVKEFGALGDGSVNDAPAIQAAFDLAFGTAAAPHGMAQKHQNRPVFFPNGQYRVDSTLTLTKVVGGYIYGAHGATSLEAGGGGPGPEVFFPLIATNGASHLRMEKLIVAMQGHPGNNTCCLYLNWDGTTGGDGLHNNLFSSFHTHGSRNGIIIADSGNEGFNNCFIHCTASNFPQYGVSIRGPNAVANTWFAGGVAECVLGGLHCPSGGGSVHAYGMSTAGNSYDLVHQSAHVSSIIGGRAENSALNMSNGTVTVRAMSQTGPDGVFANITGGKCIIEGCVATDGQITGNGGSLYISGCSFDGTTPLSGYTGTIAYNPDLMA